MIAVCCQGWDFWPRKWAVGLCPLPLLPLGHCVSCHTPPHEGDVEGGVAGPLQMMWDDVGKLAVLPRGTGLCLQGWQRLFL